MVKAAALFAAGALALACARAPDSPGATVAQYCDALPRDPVRAFLVLSPELHRTHGLRVPLSVALQPPVEQPSPPSLSQAEVAWLDIWKDPQLRVEAEGLRFELGPAREVGDTAEVQARVAPTTAPPFEQRFELSREGTGAPWRIVAISQSGVLPASAGAAFAAAPSIERLRQMRSGATRDSRRRAPTQMPQP